jgi:hypothetical protein
MEITILTRTRKPITAIMIKPLKRGFSLVYCQDRLTVIDGEKIIVEHLDVIHFIEKFL